MCSALPNCLIYRHSSHTPVSTPSLSESVSPQATHLQSGVPGVSQEKRVALVIGNGGYQELSRLPHAVNDAEDMAVALEELGFIVIPGKNLDRRAMELPIRYKNLLKLNFRAVF